MAEKEQIIFEYQVDMGGALADAERFKKNIIQTKEEQKQLNDAYKKGAVSLDEYAAESVRLEAILKKEQTTYNNLSKAMTGTKTQTDKLIESNNKLSKSMDEGLNNASIMGTNLGGLKTSVTALLNPFTAAAAGVSALAGLYAKSTIGAKDLEFAQNQLANATELVGNKFASFFSGAEDGEGILSKYVNTYLKIGEYTPIGKALDLLGIDLGDIADESKELALIQERLEDLGRDARRAQTNQQELLAENADLMQKISDSANYSEKLELSNKAIQNIKKGSEDVLAIRTQELEALRKQVKSNEQNETLQDAIAEKELQIAQEKKKTERQINNIEKLQGNINESEQKRLQTIVAQNEKLIEQNALKVADAEFERLKAEIQNQQELEAAANAASPEKMQELQDLTLQILEDGSVRMIETKMEEAAAIKAVEDATIEAAKAAEKSAKSNKAAMQSDKDRTGSLLVLSNAIGGAATIFEKHTIASKFLSAAQAGINSFLAGTEVLKDPSFVGRPLQRTVAMFATIAAGLAQQGKILGAFAGGGSFMTKGPTWLLVGDNPGGRERVDVTPVSGKGQTRIFNDGAAMAGGGSINGSILAASSTAPIDAQFGLQNALSDIPLSINFVEYDYSRFKSKLTFKEQISER